MSAGLTTRLANGGISADCANSALGVWKKEQEHPCRWAGQEKPKCSGTSKEATHSIEKNYPTFLGAIFAQSAEMPVIGLSTALARLVCLHKGLRP